MRIIDGIRSVGTQRLRTTGYEGQQIEMVLYYVPAIQRWKIDISSGNFSLNGLRVCNHPNILAQYKNTIDFGMAVLVNTDKGDPFLINDFTSGRCQIAILSKEEVSGVEGVLFEG